MTAHYVLPPRRAAGSWPGARRAFGAMDAVVAHSEHGAPACARSSGSTRRASASSTTAPSTT